MTWSEKTKRRQIWCLGEMTCINQLGIHSSVRVSERNKEAADALIEVAKVVEKSKDKDAAKYFECLVEELAQAEPSKSFLENLLGGARSNPSCCKRNCRRRWCYCRSHRLIVSFATSQRIGFVK
jgi:hypothetical protein